MTGPEHYRRAERLLEALADPGDSLSPREAALTMAAAQVYATLALAAATVDSAVELSFADEWRTAMGVAG